MQTKCTKLWRTVRQLKANVLKARNLQGCQMSDAEKDQTQIFWDQKRQKRMKNVFRISLRSMLIALHFKVSKYNILIKFSFSFDIFMFLLWHTMEKNLMLHTGTTSYHYQKALYGVINVILR